MPVTAGCQRELDMTNSPFITRVPVNVSETYMDQHSLFVPHKRKLEEEELDIVRSKFRKVADDLMEAMDAMPVDFAPMHFEFESFLGRDVDTANNQELAMEINIPPPLNAPPPLLPPEDPTEFFSAVGDDVYAEYMRHLEEWEKIMKK